ncbi:MAG TPA: phosphoglucosamine mutase [bacterium]|nr:phosphoglucosamine mutase [bacterium]
MKGLIFSVSGARGIVGQGIDAVVLTELAAHFGSWLGEGTVVVGRDSRISGEMARGAVTAGLLGAGRDVVDLGIVPTPTVGLAVRKLGAAGGIQISASHNPAEWNALKLMSSRGIFLTAQEGANLKARIDAGRPEFVGAFDVGSRTRRQDFPSVHVDEILASPLVDAEAVRERGLRCVVDCVAGAGGPTARILLERLGVKVSWLHDGPTGRFPRNPEPLPENLTELGETVREKKADIGFALDPDADRVAVVDETGRPIGEEVTLAVVVDFVLPQVGGDVVVNVSTTMAIEAVAERHGAKVRRTPVGEVNVTEEMLRCGARIGGEGNGGIIVPAVNPGRDGLLGIALWLTALAKTGEKVSGLAGRIPATVMRKEKIELKGLTDDQVDQILEDLPAGFPEARVDRTDGLKLLTDEGWVHVRRSNTEPIVRLLAEAGTETAVDDLVRRARDLVGRSAAAGR